MRTSASVGRASANTLFVSFRDRMWAVGASGSNELTDVWSMTFSDWHGKWSSEICDNVLLETRWEITLDAPTYSNPM